MAPELHRKYPASDTTPGIARTHLTAFLEEHGEASLIPVATLLVSELVTNSYLHGGDPIDVHACFVGRMLHVDVDDTGNQHPLTRDPDLNGRGLRIVDKLSTAWGKAPHGPTGTTTWFELRSLTDDDR